jgi:hypothetical protein
MILEKYQNVKHLIREGDVLLFKGKGWFSGAVRAWGQSTYTHVGVASWAYKPNDPDGILEVVEFREGSILAGILGLSGSGEGRAVSLLRQVNKYKDSIDVYRPVSVFSQSSYDPVQKTVLSFEIPFDGIKVTSTIRYLTGLPYGWKRVWWIIKSKFAFGLFTDYSKNMADDAVDIIYPVCSSVVAYAFNSNGYDLIMNRSDEWTTPGDIAGSPRLSYLFTLSI